MLAAALLMQSCTWVVAAETVKGRAFVVKASPFSGTYWNCDATKGEPTCYQTGKLGATASLPPQADAAPPPPAATPEATPAAAETPPDEKAHPGDKHAPADKHAPPAKGKPAGKKKGKK